MQKMTPAEIKETIYRLDGPLRWALGEPHELLRGVAPRPGQVVADFGAGTGYLTIPLAKAVGAVGAVHAIDRCGPLLEVLSQKARRQGLERTIRLLESSVLSVPLPDESCDLVASAYLLHELAEQAVPALREAWRLLRPNGQIVIADFRRIEDAERRRQIEAWYQAQPDGGGLEERHLRFSLAELEQMLLVAGFSDIELRTWHDFHSHALARK